MQRENGLVTPLRKKTLEGTVYTRDANIEIRLAEFEGLTQDELVARCSIQKRDDPSYVPSECLVYFVRASRSDHSTASFERLYKILAERVLRALPRAENADGKTASLTKSVIRDNVFGKFVEMLSLDRTEYSEKLDYFEVRFDGALASLRRDAQEQAWRDENRSASLEYDEETGELAEEVERAAGSFDPFNQPEIDGSDYRSRLDASIDILPPEQVRIIEMLRKGIPIDSKDADAVTIAKVLGKSEKTIRTYRDKAFAALRAAMSGDDQ
ncbi:MAG: DNA-binding response regulator [Gammaproteobacteria bacterium]|nr:DNA-binding response regulator [Gammaproteobacteria bacterium]